MFQVASSIFISLDLSSAFITDDKLLSLFTPSLIEDSSGFFLPLCQPSLCYNSASFAHRLNAIICQCFACRHMVLLGDLMSVVQRVQNWVIIFSFRLPSPIVLHIIMKGATRSPSHPSPQTKITVTPRWDT